MSRVLSLAGFQVTLIGRFWMIPEDVAKGSTRQKSSAGVDKYRRLGTFDRRKSFCRPRIAFRVNILGVNASFVVNQSCFYFFEAV